MAKCHRRNFRFQKRLQPAIAFKGILIRYDLTMQKHSWLSNLHYCMKDVASYSKLAIFTLAVSVITTITTAVLGVLLSYFVVAYLTQGASTSSFLTIVGVLCAATFVSSALLIWSQNVYSWRCTYARCSSSWIRMNSKILRTDYQNVEPREKRSILMKGFEALSSNWSGIESMMKQAPLLLIGLIGMTVYATVSTVYVPWILLVMVFMVITSGLWSFWSYKYVEKTRDEAEKQYSRNVLLSKNTTTLENAKDVRSYQMKPWFDRAYDVLSKKVFVLHGHIQGHFFLGEVSNCIFLLIRDLVAYALLLPRVINGEIDLSTFTFLIGIVSGFSTWVNTFVTAIQTCLIQTPLVTDYRNALAMKDEFNHGQGLDTKTLQKPFEISLNHVSFHYPESEKDAIRDINLDIKPGDKIAIVGNNGAGKTTLIKLLCGLYQPSEGIIKIDGHDIKEFNSDDYMSLISAVFQDVHPLAFTIKMNITCCLDEDADEKRLQEAIAKAGLSEKIASLKDGENTYISQAFNLSGIQLSGGETQKLLLARALYKGAPLLVLDEPTAALDPLSEEAMYKQYLFFSEGNTSIFISHRLASTRFCDRIVYMKDGTIKSVGTHEELLKNDPDYKEMFDLQAKYYREEPKGGDYGQETVDATI